MKTKDRLIFKSTQLKNGIWVHAKPMNVPFAIVSIVVPVGHLHNTGKILPGTAHFLEHLVCGRSHLYPEKNQFQKKIELVGGEFNALTDSQYTKYTIQVKSDMLTEAFKGLMSHVFNPIIKAEDFLLEIGAVSSERRRESKWYPGNDDFEYHCLTKWKYDVQFTSRQAIGKDSDLKKMTVAGLSSFHKNYFDPKVYVTVGGKFDEKVILKELNKIKTKKHNLPINLKQIRWANKKYHEKKFDDISRYIYHLGGVVTSKPDFTTFVGIYFIGKLLTNPVHGTLYQWLRNELGWTYSLGFKFSTGSSRSIVTGSSPYQ